VNVTTAAIGNAAQVLRIAADLMADLALEERTPESHLSLTEVVRDELVRRIGMDGQLSQVIGEATPAQKGAFALVAVVASELTECLV